MGGGKGVRRGRLSDASGYRGGSGSPRADDRVGSLFLFAWRGVGGRRSRDANVVVTCRSGTEERRCKGFRCLVDKMDNAGGGRRRC